MVHVEVVGAAPGSPPSLYLVTETKRYLFNCGEGVQRFCMANKVRLVRLGDIFLTRLGIGQYGGVPGLFLTLAEVLSGQNSDPDPNATGTGAAAPSTIDTIRVHGPAGLGAVVQATRGFAAHPTITLQEQELLQTSSNVFKDDQITVDAVVLRAAPPSCCPSKRSREDALPAQSELELLDTVTNGNGDDDLAVCYAVRLADTPGKFDAARARELGVPRGPDCARLVAGHAITLPDGRRIEPDQVVGPARPGAVFVVVECPSLAYLDALRPEAQFGRDAVLALHLAPRHLAQAAEYRAWMEAAFDPDVTHLFGDEAAHLSAATFRSSAVQQTAMHWICPESFPACPVADGVADGAALPMTRYVFRPHKTPGLDLSHLPPALDFDRICDHVQSIEVMLPMIEVLRDRQRAIASSNPLCPELLFLGTGAAAPSKYRNSSGIDLTLPACGSHVLLDCGEGVLGQLQRVYGPGAAFTSYLRALKLIWISHKHADHHVGLLNLIRARTSVTAAADTDLVVVGPTRVLDWVRTFAAHGCDRLRCRLVHNTDPNGHVQDWVRRSLGLTRFESVPVAHCNESYGIVIESPSFKIVYSGDTRPCPALVQAGLGATVLIHEATFEDELEEEAVLKKHSTTREALQVGRDMQARETILTHFSQRYPKVPCTADSSMGETTCVAFDLMKIRLDRVGVLPPLLGALDLLFGDDLHKLPV